VTTGATLDLDITSPADVDNLIVTVVEADTGADEEPKGPDALVAKFFGKVVSGTFSLVPRQPDKKGVVPPNPEVNPKPGTGAPKIKIKLGGTTHDVSLPGRDSENGVFELQIKMQAKGHRDFRSSAVVFVRDFQFFKANGVARPVIAILAGTDAPAGRKGFGAAALKFWKHHADATFDRKGMGLENVVKFLAKFKSKFGNWGEVNIINHGNMVPMFVRLFEQNDAEFIDGHKIDEELASTKRNPAAFTAALGLDNDSRVVFRACDAGNNPKILEALQTKVFGGACPVFIPKLVQVYQSDGSGESFEEMLLFFHPDQNQPSDAVVESKMKALFQQKFPGARFEDERDTYNPHGDPRGREQKFTVFVNVREDVLFDNLATGLKKTDAVLKKELQKDWTTNNRDQDDRFWLTTPGDWSVTIDKKFNNGDSPDTYWVETSVPPSTSKVPTSATPKIALKGMGTVTIGKDPSNDIIVDAPGVAAKHATVEIRSFGSTSQPLDLLINPFPGESIQVLGAGKPLVMPPVVDAESTGNVKILLGRASVTFRFPRMVTLQFGLKRFMVQRRRAFRAFDPQNPQQKFKDRPLVPPQLTNADHYGSFG
jgi:hypothetical protein